MRTTRRSLLKSGLGLGAGAGLTGLVPGLANLAAANGAGGYKALVCVYLDGGMDAYDTLIPTAPGAYGAYADARRSLIDQHEARGDDSRSLANVIPLGGTGVGMPRQLAPLAALYRTGALSVAANVGPLIERTDRAAVEDGRARLPARLGSHNDQRSVWMTGQLEGVPGASGWGGRMLAARDAGASPYGAICFQNERKIVTAGGVRPYKMDPRGVTVARGVPSSIGRREDVQAAMMDHFAASAARVDNLFATDFQNARRGAVGAAAELHGLAEATTAGDAVRIEGNALSDKFAMAAKMISLRGQLGVERQVFVLDLAGFDTHQNQATALPALQTQLAEAMAAFYQETVRLGVAQDVLTVTTSEFGRSLTPNARGTDHGWGGHQILMGGGIRGGVIHGELPEIGLEHDLDWDRGRLIPTTSVEQFAGGIGRWFGVDGGQLEGILPGLGRTGPALAL